MNRPSMKVIAWGDPSVGGELPEAQIAGGWMGRTADGPLVHSKSGPRFIEPFPRPDLSQTTVVR